MLPAASLGPLPANRQGPRHARSPERPGVESMTASQTIAIFVNGAERSVGCGTTIARLLAAQGAGNKRVAVERNGEIVPKRRHGETVLEAGDRLEVVIAVGGG